MENNSLRGAEKVELSFQAEQNVLLATCKEERIFSCMLSQNKPLPAVTRPHTQLEGSISEGSTKGLLSVSRGLNQGSFAIRHRTPRTGLADACLQALSAPPSRGQFPTTTATRGRRRLVAQSSSALRHTVLGGERSGQRKFHRSVCFCKWVKQGEKQRLQGQTD